MERFGITKETLQVIYEDNHIIVVVKPVGIPVQQDKTGDLDMLTVIKEYLKEKYQKPGNVYLGLVHRLDRMVGGVMVFAKTSKAASRLSEYIRQKNVKKKYLAIVHGRIPFEKQPVILQDYLLKNQKLNKSSVVDPDIKNAKFAELSYQVLDQIIYEGKPYSVVDIDLHTGRHHQIRVQFASRGHALYGDMKYGQKINKVGQYLALWSYYLSFYHPTKDAYLEFTVKPQEMIGNKDIGLDAIWSVIE